MEKNERVMVVCPDRTRGRNVRNYLIKAGIEAKSIVEVDNISSALANLMVYEFVMIFSDHNGAINALEFLEQISTWEEGRFNHIPFVIIAKKGLPGDVIKARNFGVTSFVLFNPPVTNSVEFLRKLKDILEGRII